MGVGVSNWRLARAVSLAGGLGVVSGTIMDSVLLRRLQLGDPGGHMQRAMAAFPVPEMANRVLERYYLPAGKKNGVPFKLVAVTRVQLARPQTELMIVGNFVEVYLAKEGVDRRVGVNYLEKVQMPHLPSIYGAMLAGVDYVLMGAGIPREIPGVLDRFSQQEPATYRIYVENEKDGETRAIFDPREVMGVELPPLKRPDFLPIIASAVLAFALARKATGPVNGFIVEGYTAGGHNAPPRGKLQLSESGEPVYGERDIVDLEKLKELGLPFWLAGGYGSPEKVREALDVGAAGVQVGTAFSMCMDSGTEDGLRAKALARLQEGDLKVVTDPLASPTGFPFKVLTMEDTGSQQPVYEGRTRVCDLGYLRVPFQREDGKINYRCASEPVEAYLKKGGKLEATVGRKCLCNALLANIGLAQTRKDGSREVALLTAGDDINGVRQFMKNGAAGYSAADVIEHLLSG